MQQLTLHDDFESNVIPFISIDGVNSAKIISSIPFNDEEDYTVSQLRHGFFQIENVIGNSLTCLILRYFKKGNPQYSELDISPMKSSGSEQLSHHLLEYSKKVLMTHFLVSKDKIVDSTKIAVGIRSVTDVITTSDSTLRSELGATKIYDATRHYYVPLQHQLSGLLLSILARFLGLKISSTFEASVLTALGVFARKVNFDKANKNFVTLMNGDLDLNTYNIVEFSASHFTTYKLSISPTSNETLPEAWQQFFTSQWGEDYETQQWLIRYFATHLLPQTIGTVAIWWNTGAGGKSLLAKLIRKMLTSDGTSLTSSASLNVLGNDFGMSSLLQSDGLSTKLANISDENSRSNFDFNLVKQLADTDSSISINRKNKSHLTPRFNVQTTLLMNELPASTDKVEVTYGARRKLNLLPFPRSFKPGEQDETLEQRMLKELDDFGGVMLS